MAQQRVLRHAVRERRVEGVYVVDTLADIAAFVKQVLIDVGHRGRVRVDAHVAGEHLRERRAVGADEH